MNTEHRQKIGALFQSVEFALKVCNLLKDPDKQLTSAEGANAKTVAMSLPRLYAVVEAAEIAVGEGRYQDIAAALEAMGNGSDPLLEDTANRCARLAWQAQQPLLDEPLSRLSRPIMGCTSGNLPAGELEKDIVRVRATAALVHRELISA